MEIPQELINDLFVEAIRDLRAKGIREERIFFFVKRVFGIRYARKLLQ